LFARPNKKQYNHTNKGKCMVLQNGMKILKELTVVEERIKQLESFLDINSIEVDREEMLKSILDTYLE
jgi:hypothetical protein